MAFPLFPSLVMFLLFIAGGYALRQIRRRRLPPGPPAWPIIGSLHHLVGGVPHRSFAKLSQQYGPFVYMMLGSMPTVLVSSAELAKKFMQTHDKCFASRPHFESANRLSYGQDMGVSTARYGAQWRELRRFYTLQLFTAKRVSQYKPVMKEEIENLIKEVRRYAERGEAYNVTAGVGGLLQSIVCRILLGKRLWEVCHVQEGYNLKEVVKQATELFITPIIGDLIPWLSFLDARAKKKMDAWHASFDSLLESVLQARETGTRAPAAADGSSEDFLQLLMATDISRDGIKAVILELLIAGIDTSSVVLDWAMAELTVNPEAFKKLEDEVVRVMGHSGQRMVEEEDLPQLVYTRAVVKETFRMHIPAPLLLTRLSMKDCKVAGYTLPQGVQVYINAWAIGRDPESWERPNTFFPDRFLGASQHVDVRGQNFELIPFGSGRRICPGIPLALPIIEMALANLVHYFHWSLPPPPHDKVDMTEKFGAVVSRTNPLFLIPSSR